MCKKKKKKSEKETTGNVKVVKEQKSSIGIVVALFHNLEQAPRCGSRHVAPPS